MGIGRGGCPLGKPLSSHLPWVWPYTNFVRSNAPSNKYAHKPLWPECNPLNRSIPTGLLHGDCPMRMLFSRHMWSQVSSRATTRAKE